MLLYVLYLTVSRLCSCISRLPFARHAHFHIEDVIITCKIHRQAGITRKISHVYRAIRSPPVICLYNYIHLLLTHTPSIHLSLFFRAVYNSCCCYCGCVCGSVTPSRARICALRSSSRRSNSATFSSRLRSSSASLAFRSASLRARSRSSCSGRRSAMSRARRSLNRRFSTTSMA